MSALLRCPLGGIVYKAIQPPYITVSASSFHSRLYLLRFIEIHRMWSLIDVLEHQIQKGAFQQILVNKFCYIWWSLSLNEIKLMRLMVLACINQTYFEWCEHHSHISHIRHVTWRDGQFKLPAEKVKNTVLQTSKHITALDVSHEYQASQNRQQRR